LTLAMSTTSKVELRVVSEHELRGVLKISDGSGSWVGRKMLLQKTSDKPRRSVNGLDEMLTTTRRIVIVVFASALVACATPAPQSASSGPRFDQGGPDADDFGARNGYPFGDRTSFFRIPFLVGSQSHQDEIFPGRLIRRTGTPSPLARAASEPALRYEYEGRNLTLDDYLARNPTTGLLVARGDTIFIERYQYARTDRDRLTSWSMAKTVT
jgi:hypothetical protein